MVSVEIFHFRVMRGNSPLRLPPPPPSWVGLNCSLFHYGFTEWHNLILKMEMGLG